MKSREKASKKTGPFVLRLGLICLGMLFLLGQGCTELSQVIEENRKEEALKRDLTLGEQYLRQLDLRHAEILFERVHNESKQSSLRVQALFFSGFCVLLDRTDNNRLQKAQNIFESVVREFPNSELTNPSRYIGMALYDVSSTIQSMENGISGLRQRVDQKRYQARQSEFSFQKQKELLSEKEDEIATKEDEIAAMKDVIRAKDKEIENLELKINKLEEIHKEIIEKRKDMT
jgi:hypothetical protein